MVAVFGHRGARGLLPENTSAGFELANEMKLTGVEFDIGVTADGIAVVHHDPHLSADFARNKDGTYVDAKAVPICELTYQELLTYDVGRLRTGTDYATRFSTQKPLDGSRIPTFDEVLNICSGLDLLVEVKSFPNRPNDTLPVCDLTMATIQQLRAHNVLEQSVLYAFDWRVLDEASIIEPQLKRCCLTEADTVKNAHLWFGKANLDHFQPDQPGSLPRVVASTGAKVWAPHYKMLSKYEVDQAHLLGLTVIPWTVNEPQDILDMLAYGVDGIISDWPDRVLSSLAARNQHPAAPGFIARRFA